MGSVHFKDDSWAPDPDTVTPVGPGNGSEIYVFNEHPTEDCTLRNAGIFDSEDPFQY